MLDQQVDHDFAKPAAVIPSLIKLYLKQNLKNEISYQKIFLTVKIKNMKRNRLFMHETNSKWTTLHKIFLPQMIKIKSERDLKEQENTVM